MKRILVALCLTGCGATDPTAIQTTDTIVFIGDSITQQWPLDLYLSSAINAGVSGNETRQMAARFDTDVIAHSPDIVVILGGINDIRNRDSADPEYLLQMAAKAKSAGAKVIMGTLPPAARNMGAYPAAESDLIDVMNDKIRKGAATHGYLVAEYHDAMTIGGFLNPLLYEDRFLHPNERGYAAMWTALAPVLRTL